MRKLSKLLPGVLPLLSLLLGGCGSRSIFHADFNRDTLGSPPNVTPPTDPPDDMIWLGAVRPTGGQFFVVDSDTLGKSLYYSNVEPDLGRRYLHFQSAPVYREIHDLWAYWNGVALFPAGDPQAQLDIHFGDPHEGYICGLRLRNDTISVQTSDGPNPTYEEIGRYRDGIFHSVMIHVNRANGDYEVTVSPRNAAAVRSGRRPALSSRSLAARRPVLSMLFSQEARGGVYNIDDVNMHYR